MSALDSLSCWMKLCLYCLTMFRNLTPNLTLALDIEPLPLLYNAKANDGIDPLSRLIRELLRGNKQPCFECFYQKFFKVITVLRLKDLYLFDYEPI
ncbi:hypothetical protein P175DRAFT_0531105 [Aspergillus ochraceoroseus IBT 24754]|uniref:Uncharacterized protein n=1 Tax=Aspergillus ochraceoroseus IBT 24754 TaxID=1392256 RepID=A0A2T5LZ80_9EURO|nr:uncharacterized protein P175DRAFT_0531105 [Aspergillus ochraceoroseus IBT 24754]PTU21584.1 hypothetical protein P175DRAFT_0531105 [Aspergillus ochraceoroseus IBT 24754]